MRSEMDLLVGNATRSRLRHEQAAYDGAMADARASRRAAHNGRARAADPTWLALAMIDDELEANGMNDHPLVIRLRNLSAASMVDAEVLIKRTCEAMKHASAAQDVLEDIWIALGKTGPMDTETMLKLIVGLMKQILKIS